VRLFSLVGLGVMAAAFGLGAPASDEIRLPAALTAPAQETPALLGVIQGRNLATLVHVDAATLKAKPKPRLELWGAWPWAFSPNRSALAVVRHAALRLVSVKRMRRLGDIHLGAGYVVALSWPAPGRVLAAVRDCCSATVRLHVVDTNARRVVRTHELAGTFIGAARGPAALVLLLAPDEGIGPSRLAVLDSSGEVRVAHLAGVSAGWSTPQGASGEAVASRREPALALDGAGQRAFVVEPEGEVTTVHLPTLSSSSHTVARAVSPLARLHAWLEPEAAAKIVDGPTRTALWLGDGILAVTGRDESSSRDAQGNFRFAVRPAGLTLIDTESWRARTLDSGADSARVVSGGLLVTGSSYEGPSETRSGMGLALYAEGGKRFQLFQRQAARVDQVYGDRALVYVGSSSALRLVDLDAGRVVDDRRLVGPRLLLGSAAEPVG